MAAQLAPPHHAERGDATAIAVIGCGYLGAVHAAALGAAGRRVIGIDTDPDRVRQLAAGNPPFDEPGLPEALRAGLATGRLSFTTDAEQARGCGVVMVCVGTPPAADGDLDTRALGAAIDALAPVLCDGAVVLGKSTVPPGTAARLARRLREATPGRQVHLVWHPEFLREGTAMHDLRHPARVVYGLDPATLAEHPSLTDAHLAAGGEPVGATATAGAPGAAAPATSTPAGGLWAELTRLEQDLTAGEPAERFVVDWATAELIKLAANSFLAAKVSFANGLAGLAADVGADPSALLAAVGADPRIGPGMLAPGLGYGGSCLPKDIAALRHAAERSAQGAELAGWLQASEQINSATLQRAARLVASSFDGSVRDHRIAILGATFKPDTDDERCSPALALAQALAAAGADVTVTDPSFTSGATREAMAPAGADGAAIGTHLPSDAADPTPQLDQHEEFQRLPFAGAIREAEALVLATAWPQYVALDPVTLVADTKARTAIDLRGAWRGPRWLAAGWRFAAL